MRCTSCHSPQPAQPASPACLLAAQIVVGRTVQLGVGLGLILMLLLGAGASAWPRLFTQDAATLRVVALLIPPVVSLTHYDKR
jgi:hypothetical protein